MDKQCQNDPYPASSTKYTVYSIAANMVLFVQDLDGVALLVKELSGFAPQAQLDLVSIIQPALNKALKTSQKIDEAVESILDRPYAELLVDVPLIRLDAPWFPVGTTLGGRSNRTTLLLAGLWARGIALFVKLVYNRSFKLDLDLLGRANRRLLDAFANDSFLQTKDVGGWPDFQANLLSFLTLLAGDGSGLPGRQGLLAALDEEIASRPDDKRSAVAVEDIDRNGIFGRSDRVYFFGLPFKLQADAVPGLWINREFRRSSMVDVIQFLTALRNNLIKGQPDRIDPAPYLNPIWTDLGVWIADGIWPQFASQIALDPYKFFASPGDLHGLLPTVYASNVSVGADQFYWLNGTPVTDAKGYWVNNLRDVEGVEYSFLIECEYANSISKVAQLVADPDSVPGWNDWLCPAHAYHRTVSQPAQYGFGYGITQGAADRSHFYAPFAASDTAYDPDLILNGYKTVPVIGSDQVYPDPETDSGLAYIGWQDPTFAGLLWVDPAGTGSWQVPTLQTINQITVRSWLTRAPALRLIWKQISALADRYGASLPAEP